jgi:hypothetical protein
MALTKLEEYHARVRDALILPFKRKMASLTIRSDIWKENLAGLPEGDSTETKSLTLGAIAEIDTQVIQLADLKLPGERKARASEAEVQELLGEFAAMRSVLVTMAGGTPVPQAA